MSESGNENQPVATGNSERQEGNVDEKCDNLPDIVTTTEKGGQGQQISLSTENQALAEKSAEDKLNGESADATTANESTSDNSDQTKTIEDVPTTNADEATTEKSEEKVVPAETEKHESSSENTLQERNTPIDSKQADKQDEPQKSQQQAQVEVSANEPENVTKEAIPSDEQTQKVEKPAGNSDEAAIKTENTDEKESEAEDREYDGKEGDKSEDFDEEVISLLAST
ncbi:hypothetical protein DdX_10318 [Ditylenchus destructor]|uniref:Uncharacterized protein n=1 Tax=Ditylenchus destructor TaxID=166010 RepID=A0AAD4R5H7_9BILA|nr:hypothetical protein DdX_10318 [Ditylenchus destructor]